MSDKLRTPADAPRDTAPQPPPVCCDPSAPIVKCCVCGADVHTCERTEPVDNDYRCPLHGNGVELNAGEWVCSDACGYERMLAGYVARIAALEAQLAEAQADLGRKDRTIIAMEEFRRQTAYVHSERIKEKEILAYDTGKELEVATVALAEAHERLAMAVEALKPQRCGEGDDWYTPPCEQARKVLTATSASVAQHTASVERRGAAKELRRIADPKNLFHVGVRELAERRAAELEGA